MNGVVGIFGPGLNSFSCVPGKEKVDSRLLIGQPLACQARPNKGMGDDGIVQERSTDVPSD